MKDLTPKFDNTAGATGQLVAAEFNDMRQEAENVVTESGQTLTVATGDDDRQLLKGIAVGGGRISRADTETAQVGEIVLPDNSSGSLTINLPVIADLFVNATVDFEQVIDQLYSVNQLTVGRSSQLIMGLAEDLVINSVVSDNTIFRFSWKAGSDGWTIKKIGTVGTTL